MLIESFIKMEPWLEHYRCYMCSEISLSLLRQACACRKYICTPCKLRQKWSQCTYCDQHTPISQSVPPLAIEFYCPSRTCTLRIGSERQLMQHCRECAYVDEQLRRQMVQIADYQCLKGHQLSIDETYGNCNVCGTQRYCKSNCHQCNKDAQQNPQSLVRYCIACRPIRCTKYHCPTGHIISKKTDRRGANCDICGISVNRVFGISFTDPDCDFDICNSCYSRLPESLDPLPSTQMIAE